LGFAARHRVEATCVDPHEGAHAHDRTPNRSAA
jgi:hypothetical protein